MKIEIDISDLRSMANLLFDAYQWEGEEHFLEIPLKLGLMEYRPVTEQELNDAKESPCYFDSEPGDMWYFVLSEKEIEKKYEKNYNDSRSISGDDSEKDKN